MAYYQEINARIDISRFWVCSTAFAKLLQHPLVAIMVQGQSVATSLESELGPVHPVSTPMKQREVALF